MREFRIRTLADLREDLDLRIWCLACVRGATIAAAPITAKFVARGWPLDLVEARKYFRCRHCRSTGHVLLLPASRPAPTAPPIEAGPAEAGCSNQEATTQLIAAFYHLNRSLSKQAGRSSSRGGYGLDGGRRTMGRWWK